MDLIEQRDVDVWNLIESTKETLEEELNETEIVHSLEDRKVIWLWAQESLQG